MATFLVVDTESLQEAVAKARQNDAIHVAEGAFRVPPKIEWDLPKEVWRVVGGDFRPPPAPVAGASAAIAPVRPYAAGRDQGPASAHGHRMCYPATPGSALELPRRAGPDVGDDPGIRDPDLLTAHTALWNRAARVYADVGAALAAIDWPPVRPNAVGDDASPAPPPFARASEFLPPAATRVYAETAPAPPRLSWVGACATVSETGVVPAAAGGAGPVQVSACYEIPADMEGRVVVRDVTNDA